MVTGGLGYVGQSLSYMLQEQGHFVVAIDNRGVDSQVLNLTVLRGDIQQRPLWQHLFSQYEVEAIYHCAGLIVVSESVRDPAPYLQQNVVAGIGMLDAIREYATDIPLIFSSSAAVYGTPLQVPVGESAAKQPLSPYGITKWQFEEILQAYSHAYGMPWVALRYFNVAGRVGPVKERHQPETHLLPRVAQAVLDNVPPIIYGSDYPTPDGTAIRDYIHMKDLTAAHFLAWNYLRKGGESRAFNVGSGHGHSVLEVIQGFERILGRDVPVVFSDRRAGDPAVLVAAIDEAVATLNYVPHHSHQIDSMVQDAWDSCRA